MTAFAGGHVVATLDAALLPVHYDKSRIKPDGWIDHSNKPDSPMTMPPLVGINAAKYSQR